jgi:hypothetical protein
LTVIGITQLSLRISHADEDLAPGSAIVSWMAFEQP